MKKEAFETLKKELTYFVTLFLLVFVIFKIAFFKESLVVLLRIVFSLFWLFALPGYFIMFYWNEKLNFTERFVIGIVLSAAVIGIFSYYIALMGLNIKYHLILLPLMLIFFGLAIGWRK
ncbi:hypothetical protein HYX01_05015 [Candidatus Woesearchaeota archaeon]|nr:hypothetical protein [Candidatus Woesearchaeota archaeon]